MKLHQEVTLLKSHGWDSISMGNKLAAYKRAGWKISQVIYDKEGQLSFIADKEIST